MGRNIKAKRQILKKKQKRTIWDKAKWIKMEGRVKMERVCDIGVKGGGEKRILEE